MSMLTVKDVGNYRREKPRLRGARIDFRWSIKSSSDEREVFMAKLMDFIREEELILSGFGSISYSGIVSSKCTLRVLKTKLKKLAAWQQNYAAKLNLFRTGKVQWVDDIYFE